MSIDWNWGYSCNRPLRQHYLPGLAVERFSDNRRPLHLGPDHRFSRRLTVWHFTHGPQSLPLGHWHLLCRTVSQRAADRAVLYRYWWCRSSCRKISACGLNRSWTQTFNSLSPPCCAWGCLPPLASASRYAPPSSRCRAGRRTPAWRWA